MNTAARLTLSLGSFVLVGSVLMLFVVEPGTGEYVISVVTVGLGLLLMILAILMARWSIQRPTFRGGNK